MSCSTTASIVQQFYTVAQWRNIQVTAYHQAKVAQEYPSLALGPLFTGFNLAIYWVQMYCYNIDRYVHPIWVLQ